MTFEEINNPDSSAHYVNFNEIPFSQKIALPSDKITLGQLRKDYENSDTGYSFRYPPGADVNKEAVYHFSRHLIPDEISRMLYLERRQVAYADLYHERLDKNVFCFSKRPRETIEKDRQTLMRFYVQMGLTDPAHAHELIHSIRDEIEEKIIPYHMKAKYQKKVRSLADAQQDPDYVKIQHFSENDRDKIAKKIYAKAIPSQFPKESLSFEELNKLLKLPSDSMTLGDLRRRNKNPFYPPRLDTSVVPWGVVDEKGQEAAIPTNLIPDELVKKLYLERFIAYQMYMDIYEGGHFLADQKNEFWREGIPHLEKFYTDDGLAQGPHSATKLIKDIKSQIESVIRSRHGVEPSTTGTFLT